jgi:hypothetical protein
MPVDKAADQLGIASNVGMSACASLCGLCYMANSTWVPQLPAP